MGFSGFRIPSWLLILLAWGPCAGGVQAQPPEALGAKNVLILHAHEANAPVFQETDRTLGRTLQSGGIPILNQFVQSLDLRRNPDTEYRKRLVEYLRAKYRLRKFDLIITMYPEALHFVMKEGRDLFPEVPILALYLQADREPPKADRRIFRHTARIDVLGTLEIALKLVPGAKRVYVVSGAHEVDRQTQEQARRAFTKWDGRLEFRYLSQAPLEETLTTLASAPRDALVLLLPYSNDVTGKSYTSPIVAQRLSQVSTVPIFGVLDVTLGHGIVGGSLISFERIGTTAGRLALDIIRGTSIPESISPVLDVPPVPMFDWRQLKRWNLRLDAVPPGSIIINREYTLWEQHRSGVIVASVLLVVQTLLITVLVANRARRRRAEQKLAEQLRLETLLADLSARFVLLPAHQVESEIQDAQRRICEVLDLDRSALWQVPEDEPGTLRLTHVHTPAGTEPVPARMDAKDFVPWSLQKLMRGETLTISTLAALPPEADRDRETFQLYGTRSTVVIPLLAEGTVLGALSFAVTRAEREWPEDVLKGFRMVAQVVANALVRRRADQALRESQARLTLAAASADARMWELESNTGRVWMTEEGRSFYGVASNEALTIDQVASFIHPDDRELWRKSIRQAFESGQAMRTEFRIMRPDGSVRWFVSQGRPHVGAAGTQKRMLGVSIDVTERRQIEERLRTSEVLSDGILSSLPGGMVIVDRSGAILRASDSWTKFAEGDGALDPIVLAVTEGQLDARQQDVKKIGPVAKEVLDGIDAVLAGTQAEFRLEYSYPTPTEERWASVSILPLLRPEGGAVIYRQDITAQQRSRLEAERLRRDLTHVGRVTTMGEMAAALAHELNQPLTAILSNAHAGERYLTQAAPPLGEIREILQDVVGDARRAGEVIQRLRSLLRKEEARFLPLDINQVIREVVVLIHTDAVLRNLVIDLHLAPDLPPVCGDRVQIQQVLLNLVLNGMEAMAQQAEGRRIVVETARATEAVAISVRDEGSGVPADKLTGIFETFYTTKPNGMGMGLAISRSIVEAHGGRIWAENNSDRGATFWFTLSLRPPEPSPA